MVSETARDSQRRYDAVQRAIHALADMLHVERM